MSPSSVWDVACGWTVAPSTSPGLQRCHPLPSRLFLTVFPVSVQIQIPFYWLVFLSQSLCRSLFLFFDKQPMCWHGEAFRRAEMCQSSPCLSDHSFIWSFALTQIFFHLFSPSLSLSLSLSFYILSLLFSVCVHLKFIHFHAYTLSWPPVTGVTLESCQLSQVNAIEGGYVNTSSPFDTSLPSVSRAKPHIWPPPGECRGVSTMDPQRWGIEIIHIWK